MKTTKTYETVIKEKYVKDEKSGLIRDNLINLTRSNIRTVCLNIIDETLSIEDEIVMKNYFKTKNDEDLRRKVEKYDIEGFRPIYNFLRGGTESIQSSDALELIAILIDFRPRPYKKYRNTDSKGEKENILIEVDNVDYSKDEEIVVTIKSKNKNLFAWISNVSVMNKLVLIVFISLVITITTLLVMSNQTRWMIWQNDHYTEVKFDTKKYELNQLKVYKEERILSFKKIIPDCNSKFFKEDGTENLWYGKNEFGQLEYFTHLGLHPETGSTLKKITKHMIRVHICPTY